jgi:hypothetical protein
VPNDVAHEFNLFSGSVRKKINAYKFINYYHQLKLIIPNQGRPLLFCDRLGFTFSHEQFPTP